jgi:hypothetical protein
MPVLTALLLASACVYQPDALIASSRPIAPTDQRGVPVHAERCTPFLLGAIPLDTGFGMQDLIDDAVGKQRDLTLVEVSIDRQWRWWLIGVTYCTRLEAFGISTKVASGASTAPAVPAYTSAPVGGTSAPAAPVPTYTPPVTTVSTAPVAPAAPAASPPAAPSGAASTVGPLGSTEPYTGQLPRGAYMIADQVYTGLGRPRPTDPAVLDADVRFLYAISRLGKGPDVMIAAIKAGAARLGRNDLPLRDLLRASGS